MTELRRNFVSADDSASIDSFGRWRVGNPATLFDSKQTHDNQPLLFEDVEVSGSGTSSTYTQAEASTVIGVSDSTAGRRVRRTYVRSNYQPGKSLEVLLTGVLQHSGAGQAGIQRRFGYFDDDNGFFLEDDEGTIKIVRKSSVTGSTVNTKIAQADWNLDPMDGSGPSGITLDFTKSQIFFMDLEWLGVGRVRTGFVVDGLIIYAHQFLHANVISGVYISTPNLPISYEIENDGTGGAAELEHICCSVVSEGGQDKNGVLRHADSATLGPLTAGTTYLAVGVRLEATHFDVTIDFTKISAVCTTQNDKGHWELRIGGTVGAGTETWNPLTNSAVEVALGNGTLTHSGGTSIDGGYFTDSTAIIQDVENALRLGSTIAGVAQELFLVFTPISANTSAALGLTWRELI